MATVIIGAGIIGVSTAFYLSEPDISVAPSSIYLIESSPGLFASASGYAGGFLANDWFSPPSSALGALSFKLHEQLAGTYDGPKNWGYSKTTTVSLSPVSPSSGSWLEDGRSRVAAAPTQEEAAGEAGPSWLKLAHLAGLETIDDRGGTAQMYTHPLNSFYPLQTTRWSKYADRTSNPLRLCQFLLSKCRERGVQLLHPATPTPVIVHDDNDETPFTLTVTTDAGAATDIDCKRILLTAGAWTPRVFSRLFPSSKRRIPVSSLAGYSIVLRSPHWAATATGAHAVYTVDDESGYSPEVFARAGGELYIAGVNDPGLTLPKRPTDRVIERPGVERLRATARRLLEGELAEGVLEGEEGEGLRVVREGLCWRPVTSSGSPIIDQVKVRDGRDLTTGSGVWTAVGHGPWGISLSLGTGKVLSEMALGKATSADVRRLRLEDVMDTRFVDTLILYIIILRRSSRPSLLDGMLHAQTWGSYYVQLA